MASQKHPITFPPGRMVWGDLYKGRDKDFEGRPLVYKTGNDAGKPRVDWQFGLAIPKGAGPGAQHWAHTEWGKIIWQAGHSRVANAGSMADFAWKISDGDSAVLPPQKPNKPQGKAPKDRPGYAGCWVVSFSSSFAPQVFNAMSGTLVPLTQDGVVNPGDYIQVAGAVGDNESQGNPGVFINHGMVALSGYGERIITGMDPSAAGFALGVATGASATPVGGVAMPPAGGGAPAAPTAPSAPVAGASPPPPPGAAAAPPATTAHVMLPAAGGVSYETFRQGGWTDEQLVQHGKMAAPTVATTAAAAPPPQVPVVPNAAYAPPPAAAAPPPPAATKSHVMLAAAGNVPYEAYIAKGWTDATLVQHGMMAP